MTRTSRLYTRLLVSRDLPSTFAFFADAANLERLTPPWIKFEILTPRPIPMEAGTLIDYRLRLRGIPITWRTEIAIWEPNRRFVDVQLRGPYRLWRHTHSFTPTGEGTLVEDTVDYRPLGGSLVDRFLVRPDVRRIFTYRQQALLDALDVPARHPIEVHID